MDDGLVFQCCIRIEGSLYFAAKIGDGLFRYKDGETEFLGHLLDNDRNKCFDLFSGINEYDGKLYFTPLLSSHIVTYDIVAGSFDRIVLNNDGCNYEGGFVSSFILNGILYMFPVSYPGIVCVNLKSKEITVVDDWIEDYSRIAEARDSYFGFGFAIQDDQAILPMCAANAVFIFDLGSFKWDIRPVAGKGNGFSSICYDDGYCWLMPRRGDYITKYNIKSGDIGFIKLPVDSLQNGSVGAFVINGSVFAVSEYESKIIRVELENDCITELPIEIENGNRNNRNDLVSEGECICAFSENDNLQICMGKKRCLVEIDTRSCLQKSFVIPIPDFYKEQYRKCCIFRTHMIRGNCFSEGEVSYESDSLCVDTLVANIIYGLDQGEL